MCYLKNVIHIFVFYKAFFIKKKERRKRTEIIFLFDLTIKYKYKLN